MHPRRTDGPVGERELSPAACAPAAAGRSRRRLPYLVVGPERRVRGQWGRHGGGIVGARLRFRREVGCPVSSLRYVLVFARGRTKGDDARPFILEGSWVDTLKDVAPRRPHRQSRSLWENVFQMNIDSRRRKDGVQSHQESSGNNREQPLGGNDVRRKPRPITGHRKKTRFPQNCSAGAQIESRILDNDPGVFHSFSLLKVPLRKSF